MAIVSDEPRLLGDGRASQLLRIVTLGLVVLVLGGIYTLGNRVGGLDQDDQLINRGQEATICVGDLSDDKFDWLFVAVGEVFDQIQAIDEGGRIDLTEGEDAVANGRRVAQLQEQARRIHADLIEADDPDAPFVCPTPDPALDSDNVPIDP